MRDYKAILFEGLPPIVAGGMVISVGFFLIFGLMLDMSLSEYLLHALALGLISLAMFPLAAVFYPLFYLVNKWREK